MKSKRMIKQSRPNMEKILLILVLRAVFCSFVVVRLSSKRIIRQGIARAEYAESFELLRMCHVARSLSFLERLRARYVEHTCSADQLLSINVIAIRLRVLT